MIKLSKRLQAVCDMVDAGSRVCDVGCDHAFVEIRLLQEGKAASALAMDVADGPLSKARTNLELTEMEDRCVLRKSDGLAEYRAGEADTMICTGIGGILMRSILDAEPEKAASFRQLILSPQTEIALVREWLCHNGFLITAEKFLLEDGKYYTIMKARPLRRKPCDQLSDRAESEARAQRAHSHGSNMGENRDHIRAGEERHDTVAPVHEAPDWKILAAHVRTMPDQDIVRLSIDRDQTEKVLSDPGFRQFAENTYGPCILKEYIEGVPSESAEVFHQFLVNTLRSKLLIVRNLSGMQDSENAMERLSEISGEIGILQVILASRMIYSEMT